MRRLDFVDFRAGAAPPRLANIARGGWTLWTLPGKSGGNLTMRLRLIQIHRRNRGR